MAFRFYAVRIGKKTGIYTDIKEAQAQIHEISCSEMKGFNVKEDAQAWLAEKIAPRNYIDVQDSHVVAYTDGSYNREYDAYSSGIVIYCKNQVVAELSSSSADARYIGSSQAAGELFAVIDALSWAVMNQCKSIEIRYDFETASKLAVGLCRANAAVSVEYCRRYRALADVIGDDNITFAKVKAHSGDAGNSRADQLARIAAGKKH